MELTIRTDGPRRLVDVVGRFDADETARFRAALEGLLGPPAAELHLDLSQVAFLDSSALAEVVRAMKLARTGGGDLVLAGVSVPVRVILELTGLDRALTITDDGDGPTAPLAVVGERPAP